MSEERNYEAIIRVKGSDYPYFASGVNGNIGDPVVKFTVTNKDGETKTVQLAGDQIVSIETPNNE